MPSYIFLFLFPILLSKIIKIGHPMSKSKVKATSDDYLLDFSVNGISVDIEAFKDLCTWQTLKTFELYLKPGDVLSFESMNEAEAASNPRGMAASIEYVTKNGEIAIYNTGDGWICDDQPALKQQKIASTYTWGPWKNFFSGETWVIWGPLKNVKSVCKFTIPEESE